MTHRLTRREVLAAGVTGGAALSAGSLLNHPLIRAALAAPPACGRLGDIEHVVILVQENRSFDHCFGSYRGVRGFADPAVPMLHDGSALSVLAQPGYASGFDGDHLYPFHLDSSRGGECTKDINHGWGPQHGYWNGGRMDGFVRGHIAIEGALDGPLTMGHYTRSDLQFLYALADAFPVCDRYHCSVIGPTDPNRLYTMSASIDPSGTHGGPILSTSATRIERFGTLTHTTMPEQLEARGISWKVYASVDGNYGDNVLPHFHNILANPLLVISPFSRGGLVSSDVFDHTSLLRFIETRFGAEVPNLTAWRRSAVGDLTSAFDFAAPDASVPSPTTRHCSGGRGASTSPTSTHRCIGGTATRTTSCPSPTPSTPSPC